VIVLAVFVLALAPTMTAHASVVLFDNGPLVNSPGTGAGGADESRLQDSSLGMNVFGFTASDTTVFRVADDVTVPAGGWSTDEVVFFAYQTGSSTTSTFDNLTYRVWDGEPGGLGSSVVLGDTTTNRLLSGTWTGIYRTLESTPGGTVRPIMALTGDANFFVTVVGPVGVGKTFLAHALAHAACRRGYSVLAVQADRMLKTLKQARLLNAYEAELRKLIAVDLLVVDDFALDMMDAQESRDTYDIFTERHRCGSMILTSNRGPDEWLATLRRPAARPERRRPLHQRRLRPRHRGRKLSEPPKA
jgi:hypothetical protein